MNPQPDDFTQLRRLLALKRHEKPPPGYFESFSREVIVRIHAGEQVRDYSLLEALSWEAPWLQRLWAILERKPMFAGGFGVAVCGVLLAGLLLSEKRDPSLTAANVPVATEQQTAQIEGTANPSTIPAGMDQPRPLSERLNEPQTQPVLFSVPPGN